MLITNFASGELSETLFGRTDLPQYFSGVSRLENFDVIPTGGIHRRNGTKRLKAMEREGRIIPFILDREHHFLLYLMPEVRDGDGAVASPAKIEIYKNGEMVSFVEDTFKVTGAAVSEGGAGYGVNDLLSIGTGDAVIKVLEVDGDGAVKTLVVDNPGSYPSDISGAYGLQGGSGSGAEADIRSEKTVPLYRELNEIKEVQYAQNYDRMILTHENYPPLGLMYHSGNGPVITVGYLYIKYVIDEVNVPGIEASDSTQYDMNYVPAGKGGKGWLTSEGGFPRAVSFFSNRLIFAGTKNSPQRIFASRTGEFDNFSTRKLFRSEQREYITITGTINLEENYILMTHLPDIGKFSYPYQDYYINSPYYEENTKILGLFGNKLYIDAKPKKLVISSDTLAAVAEWSETTIKNDTGSREYFLFTNFDDSRSIFDLSDDFYFTYFAGKIEIRITNRCPSAYPTYYETKVISPEDAEKIVLNLEEFRAYLNDLIASYSRSFRRMIKNNNEINAFLNDFWTYMQTTMQKEVSGGVISRTFYGSPSDIYRQISENSIIDTGEIDTYITLYVKIPLEEEYPTPDDGFTFEIASDMSDAIKWIGQNKNLLIGTETAEWVIPAGVNATNVQAVLNSRYGSDKIQGTAVGDAFCFFQTGAKALVEYYIPQQDNNFRANNMAMLSPGMLHESPAFDFDFVSAPYTKIFVSREDGIAVSLLYERNTGTFAWGRIITCGAVKSVATMPGESGYDEVYLIAERSGAFFLERLDERGRVYLDSNRPWTGSQDDWDRYDNHAAVVYDGTDDRVYPANEAPAPGDFSPPHRMYIGYPFTSRVKSMPVLANDRMKQNNIKALKVRFRDSFMPKVRSEPNGVENTIPFRGKPGEGFSGVVNVPFPGVYERDVFFEFVFEEPRRCEILAVNAEVN
ncbi:MAG: hypothetical protein LBF63_01765 [Treponema sp.]|jgi:hypothetical protein|nr:hypothetical protein [Treponema sp.]